MAMGRPPKYNEKFHCEDFVRLSKLGKSKTQIAAAWDIDRDTIQEWSKKHKNFSVAVKKGRSFCEAHWQDLGYRGMVGELNINGKNRKLETGIFVWMTRNMFGWSDRDDKADDDENDLDIDFSKHGEK